MHTDRFTLTAITVVAVLAASLTTSVTPGWLVNPLLTWAITYTTAVLGTARVAHLHPGRTLVASGLLLAHTLALILTTMRAAIDAALTLLAQVNARGIDALKEATA